MLPLPLMFQLALSVGRYGARAAFAPAVDATSDACACLTAGPASASARSAALSTDANENSWVESSGLAVTVKVVPTRRVSAAFAVLRS